MKARLAGLREEKRARKKAKKEAKKDKKGKKDKKKDVVVGQVGKFQSRVGIWVRVTNMDAEEPASTADYYEQPQFLLTYGGEPSHSAYGGSG